MKLDVLTDNEREILLWSDGARREAGDELYSMVERLTDLVAAERTRRLKAEEVVDALADALTWASGSDDFNEGGEAREGWLKLGRPAIDAWLEYRTQYPREEEEKNEI